MKFTPKKISDVKRRISFYERGLALIDSNKQTFKPTTNKKSENSKNVKALISKIEAVKSLESKVLVNDGNKCHKRFDKFSKYRHMTCTHVGSNAISGINIPLNESPMIDINEEFCAFAVKSRLTVVRWSDQGQSRPAERQMKARISYLKWHPHDNVTISSSGEDGIIFIWNVTEYGILYLISQLDHESRVQTLSWNPNVKNQLASAASDRNIKVWDVARGERLSVIKLPVLAFSISWASEGNYFAAATKDGFVRTYDPASSNALSEFSAHAPLKDIQATLLKDGRIFSSGMTQFSVREIALWDSTVGPEPLFKERIDDGIGTFFHAYDPDHNLMFLMAKGGAGFRVFEIIVEAPFLKFLTRYYAVTCELFFSLPRINLDRSNCEIKKMVMPNLRKKLVAVVSIRVPKRYPEMFQPNLYQYASVRTI